MIFKLVLFDFAFNGNTYIINMSLGPIEYFDFNKI